MSLYLVTGGAGFVGSALVRELLRRGERVRVVDDFSVGLRENLAEVKHQIELFEVDITDLARLHPALDGVDYVLHQAALRSVPRSVDNPLASNYVNVVGTLNVLVAARDAGVKRFVYGGSSTAYGDTPTLPKHESMPPNPISPYAVSKLAGEMYARVFKRIYCVPTVCLRYFNLFGPRQDPRSPYSAVLSIFIDALIRGERPHVFGDGEQSRDFTYVDNAVQANLLACTAPAAVGEVINIATGQRQSLNRTLGLLRKLVGTDVEPIYGPPRTGDVLHAHADISRARELLGYEPKVSFEEGLAKTVHWYQENWEKYYLVAAESVSRGLAAIGVEKRSEVRRVRESRRRKSAVRDAGDKLFLPGDRTDWRMAGIRRRTFLRCLLIGGSAAATGLTLAADVEGGWSLFERLRKAIEFDSNSDTDLLKQLFGPNDIGSAALIPACDHLYIGLPQDQKWFPADATCALSYRDRFYGTTEFRTVKGFPNARPDDDVILAGGPVSNPAVRQLLGIPCIDLPQLEICQPSGNPAWRANLHWNFVAKPDVSQVEILYDSRFWKDKNYTVAGKTRDDSYTPRLSGKELQEDYLLITALPPRSGVGKQRIINFAGVHAPGVYGGATILSNPSLADLRKMVKQIRGEPYYQALFHVNLRKTRKGELIPDDVTLVEARPLEITFA